MLLARFARVDLSHAPTPLEPLDRLRQALGGPRLWIRRDDCTGLAQGGNKARKLEFLVADALASSQSRRSQTPGGRPGKAPAEMDEKGETLV